MKQDTLGLILYGKQCLNTNTQKSQIRHFKGQVGDFPASHCNLSGCTTGPFKTNPFSSKDGAWGLWGSWLDFNQSLTPKGGVCMRWVSHSISIMGENINWRHTVCLFGQASYALIRSGLTTALFTELLQLSTLFPSSIMTMVSAC